MEMEEITKEPEERVAKAEGTNEAKSEVEAETDVYSSLRSPTEDLYAEAKFPSKAPKKIDGLNNVRLWRVVSLCLGVLCLILILVIVLLALKFQNGPPAPVCHETNPVVSKALNVAVKDCQLNPCMDGWLHYGNSCFYLSTLRKEWDEAQKNCSVSGGNLVVISSPGLQKFLTDNGDLFYWIGLRYDQSWTWVNSKRLTQSYWSDEKYRGNCAMLRGKASTDKSWFQSPCTRRQYFICELALSRN